jgi:hypothetical protein
VINHELGKDRAVLTKGVMRIVYQRTDSTMAKLKSTKGQTTIYNTLSIKLKIE